uniref:Uncharacterized protein n=1 Tax=Triticum urartu TaxID=4572 RepID=A0A8R7TMJ5_TRIUA
MQLQRVNNAKLIEGALLIRPASVPSTCKVFACSLGISSINLQGFSGVLAIAGFINQIMCRGMNRMASSSCEPH